MCLLPIIITCFCVFLLPNSEYSNFTLALVLILIKFRLIHTVSQLTAVVKWFFLLFWFVFRYLKKCCINMCHGRFTPFLHKDSRNSHTIVSFLGTRTLLFFFFFFCFCFHIWCKKEFLQLVMYSYSLLCSLNQLIVASLYIYFCWTNQFFFASLPICQYWCVRCVYATVFSNNAPSWACMGATYILIGKWENLSRRIKNSIMFSFFLQLR